eukprot:scaffold1869_cov493-Prasinococcus_capsulatus_cf.AAC.3
MKRNSTSDVFWSSVAGAPILAAAPLLWPASRPLEGHPPALSGIAGEGKKLPASACRPAHGEASANSYTQPAGTRAGTVAMTTVYSSALHGRRSLSRKSSKQGVVGPVLAGSSVGALAVRKRRLIHIDHAAAKGRARHASCSTQPGGAWHAPRCKETLARTPCIVVL